MEKFNNFTKEYCYYLGFLWADGYVGKYKVQIEVVKEDGYALFSDIFSQISIEGVKIYDTYRERKNRKPQIAINICNVEFIKWLSIYDYLFKSNSFPYKILSIIPEDLKRYFYLGLIDGDGCFYLSKNKKTQQFYITSNYEQDWSHIISLFGFLDINMFSVSRNIVKNNGNKYSFIRVVKNSEIEKLANYLYPNKFEFGLKRKYDKVIEMMDNKPSYKMNNQKIDVVKLKKDLIEFSIKDLSKIYDCSERKIYEVAKKNLLAYRWRTKSYKHSCI